MNSYTVALLSFKNNVPVIKASFVDANTDLEALGKANMLAVKTFPPEGGFERHNARIQLITLEEEGRKSFSFAFLAGEANGVTSSFRFGTIHVFSPSKGRALALATEYVGKEYPNANFHQFDMLEQKCGIFEKLANLFNSLLR